MVFYISYAITLLFLCYHLYKNGKKIELFNIFSILIFIFFGPAFFTYNTVIDDISSTEALCLTITVVSLFLGKYLCKVFIDKLNVNNTKSQRSRIREVTIKRRPFMIIYFFSILLFYLALFQFGGINNIMILAKSGGTLTPQELKELRFDFKVDGLVGSLIGYFEVIGVFLSMLMFAFAIEYKQKFLLLINFFFCLIIMLWGVSTLHKASAFFYILQLSIFFYLLKKTVWEWNTKLILKAILLILILIVPIYLSLTPSEDAVDAIAEALNRVTNEPNRVLREYFIWWPNYFSHRLGLNIRQIHAIFGHGEFEPAYKTIVYQYNDYNNPFAGTWPTIFIGDAWVNFSYYGVLMFSIVAGFVLTFLDYILKNYRNSYGVALFAGLVGSLFTLIENSLLTAFLTGGLLILPLLFKILMTVKND